MFLGVFVFPSSSFSQHVDNIYECEGFSFWQLSVRDGTNVGKDFQYAQEI
jgi:hypothetical protein